MRKLARAAVLLGLGLVLGAPVNPDPASVKTFTNCDAGGSAAQTLTKDRLYVMSVFDEEVFVCFAATGSTCASGGIRVAPGVVKKLAITDDIDSVSCRSAGATGDVTFYISGT